MLSQSFLTATLHMGTITAPLYSWRWAASAKLIPTQFCLISKHTLFLLYLRASFPRDFELGQVKENPCSSKCLQYIMLLPVRMASHQTAAYIAS